MTLYRLLLRSLRRPSPLYSFTVPRPTTTVITTATTTLTRSYSTRPQDAIWIFPRQFGYPQVTGCRVCCSFHPSLHEIKLHNRLKSIILAGDLDLASSIVRDAVLSEELPLPCRNICINLMNAMNSAGRYEDVVALFSFFFDKLRMGVPDICCYNVLIGAHCGAGHVDQALDVYRRILEEKPEVVNYESCRCHLPGEAKYETYRYLIKGLISANRISDARDLLHCMHEKGLRNHALIYNNFISAYLELNEVESANHLLNLYEHSKPFNRFHDGFIYATYMDYYFKHDMEKEAMESYQRFLDLGLLMFADTCNVILEVLLKHGKSVEASALFEHQLNSHHPSWYALSSQTFNIMVNECFRSGKVSEALLVFRRRGTHDNLQPFLMDAVGYNNIIGKFCGIGMVAEADKLFEEMLDISVAPNFTTFEILFDAYFKEERTDDVLKWFKYLLFETNLKPSSALLNSVFSKVINKGKIEEAAEILGRMPERDPEPFPTSSFELVLAELCKRGKLDHIRVLLGVKERYDICITPTLQGILYEAFGIGQNKRLLGGLNEGGCAQGFQSTPDLQHAP